MVAGSTVLSLCNRSLLQLGNRSLIGSLNEVSPEAQACNLLYQVVFQGLARTARWGCLRKQATLTLLAAAQGTPENQDGTSLPLAPVGWLYSYASPSDNLFIREIIPSLPNSSPTGTPPITTASVTAAVWLPNGGQIPFLVEYSTDAQGNPIETILTNQSQAIAAYTVNNSNPQIFDSLFEQALVNSLAAYLCPALNLQMQLMQVMIKSAEELIMQARTADGNETPTCQDSIPDWIRARSAGTYAYGWNGYNPTPFSGYSMSWPGGF